MLRECTCRAEDHTARLLPRAGCPSLPMEVKGAGSVTIEASLPALSSFRFLESEPRSRRSGEALPAPPHRPLASRQHGSDGSGGLAGLPL